MCVRAVGSLIIVRDTQGNDFPGAGRHLETVPNERGRLHRRLCRRLAAFAKPLMTVALTFADEGGKTRYTDPKRWGGDLSPPLVPATRMPEPKTEGAS